MRGQDAAGPARSEQIDGLLVPAGDRVDELEALDAVVVVGPGLDHRLLEGRDLAVAGGPLDAHLGGPVDHGPDEVLRAVPAVGEGVGIDQCHAVAVVAQHVERGGPLPVPARLEAEGRAAPQAELTGPHRLVGNDGHRHRGPFGGMDVAPRVDSCGQPQVRRIAVLDVDPLDAGGFERRDGVAGRGDGTGADAVREAAAHRRHLDPVAVGRPAHPQHLGAGPGAQEGDGGRGADGLPRRPPQARADRERIAGDDPRVPGLDLERGTERHGMQPRAARYALEGGPPEDNDRRHDGGRRAGRQQCAAQAASGHGAAERNPPDRAGGVAENQCTERRGDAGGKPGRTGQPILELGAALLDVASQLAVGRWAPQRPERPERDGGHREEHGRRRGEERDIGRGETVDDEHDPEPGRTHAACAGKAPKGRDRPPPPADGPEERPDLAGVRIGHAADYATARASHASATRTASIAARAYHQ